MAAARNANGDAGRCMMYGCLCCYEACDCGNPVLLFKGSEDFLCIRHSCCVALNTPNKGMGCTGDENRRECCKLGLFCCDLGLIWPTHVCGCASQCLCCYNVASFPCTREYIPAPGVCSCICPFCQICPKCGCCKAPPPCPALDMVLRDEVPLIQMDRGDAPAARPSNPPEEATPAAPAFSPGEA